MSTVCARRGLFSAEAVVAARAENRKMKQKTSVECNGQDARCPSRKVINRPAASRTRGLDVDGTYTCNNVTLRPRAGARELLCTWREACKAADYVLEHFGNKSRDRGIWIWYCRRIGLDVFLDIADEVISSARQGELRWPTRALQRHLQEALPRPASALRATARQGGGAA